MFLSSGDWKVFTHRLYVCEVEDLSTGHDVEVHDYWVNEVGAVGQSRQRYHRFPR